MTYIINDFDPTTGQPDIRCAFQFPCPTWIQIQCKGPQSVRISHTREELIQTTPGFFGGLEITNAMGIQSIVWDGPLWVTGGAALTIYEIMVQRSAR